MSQPGAWARWVALCSRQEDALPVALIRVMTGLTVAGHIAHIAVTGALPLVWYDAAHGGLQERVFAYPRQQLLGVLFTAQRPQTGAGAARQNYRLNNHYFLCILYFHLGPYQLIEFL